MRFLIIILMVLIQASPLFSQNRVLTYRGKNFKTEEIIEKEMPMISGQILKMELDNASDISINGWDDETISIKIYKKGPEAELIEFKFAQTDLGVEIHGWMNESDVRRLRADIEIQVPHNANLEISAYRSESKINVEAIEGKVKVRSCDDLNLQNIRGDIDLAVSEGDVTLYNVLGSIKIIKVADLAKGLDLSNLISSHADKVAGQYPVRCHSALGDIKVRLKENSHNDIQDIEIFSEGGDIELAVPEDFSMQADIELVYREDLNRECDIYSDFGIDIEKPDKWEIIPTQYVKWTDSDDNRYTVYGMWADNSRMRVKPLYKERSLGGDKGYSMTTLSGKSMDVESMNEQITPISIHQKTIIGAGIISDGKTQIDIKALNGSVYLLKN
jgi:hypothetical protein